VAVPLAGTGQLIGRLAAGLIEGLLTATVERGIQLVGDGSLEFSPIEQIAGIGRSTGGDWVL
jgi:hypothetical protein